MKKEISWLIALGITLYLSVLQLVMCSTSPLDVAVDTGKQIHHLQLPRSHAGDSECALILHVEDISVSGYLLYGIKSVSGTKTKIDFKREGDKLVCNLPVQSPSGELEYQVFLKRGGVAFPVNDAKPITIRFKGNVPLSLTLLYGSLIVTILLFSNLAGLFAALGVKIYKWMVFLTVLSLAGLVIFVNPLIQKLAFNKLFTIPEEWDLNSKIFLSFLIWSLAMIISLWKSRRLTSILASSITAIIFLIPHRFGEEEPAKITIDEIQKNFIALLQLF